MGMGENKFLSYRSIPRVWRTTFYGTWSTKIIITRQLDTPMYKFVN
jgi:hypothetical protein